MWWVRWQTEASNKDWLWEKKTKGKTSPAAFCLQPWQFYTLSMETFNMLIVTLIATITFILLLLAAQCLPIQVNRKWKDYRDTFKFPVVLLCVVYLSHWKLSTLWGYDCLFDLRDEHTSLSVMESKYIYSCAVDEVIMRKTESLQFPSALKSSQLILWLFCGSAVIFKCLKDF